jgi:hypothetical protein
MAQPNTSNISTYNAFGKQNYNNLPPSNPVVDWDNPSQAQCSSDVAAIGQTNPRFVCKITLAATTGSLVLVSWWAVWQNVTPTTPILTRNTTGQFTITLPTVVSSEYQASIGNANTENVNLSQPIGAGLTGTTFGFVNVNCSGNIVNFNTADNTGTASDLVGQTIYLAVR